jgi:CheY-like chemotaxis protein
MADYVFLHADDDDATHQMLQIAIEDLKIPVQLYRVKNGEETLAFLRKHGPYQAAPQPDLVVLDLNLPMKSGRDVLTDMRGDDSLSGIHTVVFTSSSLSSERRQVLALGAKDYIVKPPTFQAFLAVVRSLYSHCIVKG